MAKASPRNTRLDMCYKAVIQRCWAGRIFQAFGSQAIAAVQNPLVTLHGIALKLEIVFAIVATIIEIRMCIIPCCVAHFSASKPVFR